MAKRRSCRRTVDEDKIHEKAVKMRKMTDEQLVHYVEDRVEKARSEGFSKGFKDGTGKARDMAEKAAREREDADRKRIAQAGKTAAQFLAWLGTAKVAGIGAATVSKLQKAAAENGYA